MFVINDSSVACQKVLRKYLIIARNYMYADKTFYLTASFYEDINDPIILKTAHFIDYNLLLSNVLDERRKLGFS